MCDIESYIYLPLLEEIGYIPTEKYARAAEILEHSRAIGRHFGLYDGALFQTEVTELRWDDDARRWLVSTDRGDELRARFVCMANGPLHRPKLPGIAGIETFAGPLLPHQPLGLRLHRRRLRRAGSTDSRGKRVGIIGTGATAVQCVPARRRGRRAALRLPAHAVVDRRARQPPDGSGVGGDARAGLAAAAHGELQQPRDRRRSRPRTSSTTGGRTSSASCCCGCATPTLDGPQPGRRGLGRRDGRLREDGADPRAGRHHRQRPGRPPSRSSRTTGSSASGRASTTSTSTPSTVRT